MHQLDNKVFDIIDARRNYEEFIRLFWGTGLCHM